MSVYIPSQRENKITHKPKPAPIWMYPTILETAFPTWEEAHGYLVRKRESELEVARTDLIDAQKALKGAISMTEPARKAK
jgi:hypothetical protein